MARPSKSVAVLGEEKRSHRTKAEMRQRAGAEKALATGRTLKERAEVRENETAHREFKRVYALLAVIGKNDALYEPIINRYCMLQAECADMEEMKTEFRASRQELKEEYQAGKIGEDVPGGLTPSAYYKLLSTMQGNILALDKQIQAKQKMMFDIEKECAMTISSAMRSIPKAEKKENPLAALLHEEEEPCLE